MRSYNLITQDSVFIALLYYTGVMDTILGAANLTSPAGIGALVAVFLAFLIVIAIGVYIYIHRNDAEDRIRGGGCGDTI